MSDLVTRLDGLAAVVEHGRGRVPDASLGSAETVVERAGERLKLSGDHTIVALAGATGSGKSSLFNALTEMDLAGVGLRRPTTSWALACAWGPDGAEQLLEWMGIPPRHQVSRQGMLASETPDELEGLILLDLPDHDSTEVSHHLEMDRLVQFSDLLVWVLDPQKYADAALHERYIRPMAGFADVTLVVLNQIDRIPYEQRQTAIDDVQRLVAADGLPDAKVIGVAAVRGDGLAELRAELAGRIAAKNAAKERLSADVDRAAHAVADVAGSTQVPEVSDSLRSAFADSLADSAGVPQLVDAVRASTRRESARRAGWPPLRWFRRADRDEPLEPAQVQRAAADLAVRDLTDQVTEGFKMPWRAAVRAVTQRGDGSLSSALDDAMRHADLGARPRAWTRVVQTLQWVLLLGLVVSLLWLGQQGLVRWFDLQIDLPDLGAVGGVPVAALAAGGCFAAGLLLDVVGRLAARRSADRAAAETDATLRSAIGEVAGERVLRPVEGELAAYARYREGLLAAID